MSTNNLAIFFCRAAGLVLLVIGLSQVFSMVFDTYPVLFGERSGWTSYAPIGGHQPGVIDFLPLLLRGFLPSLLQSIAGTVLLLLGRRLGLLLARGLTDPKA